MDLQTDILANQPIGRTNGVLSLVGSLQRFQQFDVTDPATNTTSDPSQYGTQVRLQFQQPLFTYNRLKVGLRRAELNLETTLQTYSRNQLDNEMCQERQKSEMFFWKNGLLKFSMTRKPSNNPNPIATSE